MYASIHNNMTYIHVHTSDTCPHAYHVLVTRMYTHHTNPPTHSAPTHKLPPASYIPRLHPAVMWSAAESVVRSVYSRHPLCTRVLIKEMASAYCTTVVPEEGMSAGSGGWRGRRQPAPPLVHDVEKPANDATGS